MPQGENARRSMDPVEIWKQWYETSSRLWSTSLDGEKSTFFDPYALYQSWLKSIGDGQLKSSALGTTDPREAWKQWFETTLSFWRTISSIAGDPLGLTSTWIEMMKETSAKFLKRGTLPEDPFTIFRELYEATSERWSEAVEQVLKSEQFMEFSSQSLENYASVAKAFRRVNEEYLRNLQLPTRSDITRVAELVVALEEKIDQIEDSSENFEGNIGALEERLTRVEETLARLSTVLEQMQTTESVSAQLNRLESKLENLNTVVGKIEATTTSVIQQPTLNAVPAVPKEQKKKPNAKAAKDAEATTELERRA